jgi:hypothetical protein
MLAGDGRKLGKAPLNYAFGRLHVDLPRGAAAPAEAEVVLSPGFADPQRDQRWAATVSIRLYADSAHVNRLAGQSVSVAPGATGAVVFPLTASALQLGEAFAPLGIVVVPEGERTWTREATLQPADMTRRR